MAKLLLTERSLIPSFELFGRDDLVFNSSVFKRKQNLCLFFIKNISNQFLTDLEEIYPEILKQNSELVVVSDFEYDEIKDIHRKHRLTFWLLGDPAKKVFEQFIDCVDLEDVAALFITDKQGEIFFQYLASCINQLPPLKEVVRSLEFIESQ